MRRIIIAVTFVAALAVSYGLGTRHRQEASGKAPAGSPDRRALYYVDPMHPNYKSDRPGTAPDCGMPLEPVFADDRANTPVSGGPLPGGAVRIDSGAQRLAGIRIATVEQAGASRTIRVAGRVAPEDTRIFGVNAGVDGFIRETHNDSFGTRVRKDQKLAAFYAPDFLAAASGFLAARERVPGAVTTEGARSIQNYTDRLRNLGMSDSQIKQISETRQLPESIDVVSPVDGFILARNISPGQHFEHSLPFYQIADLRQVWVLAEIDQRDESFLRSGAPARVELRDGEHRWNARVSDSLPQSELAGGTAKLRLEVENPGFVLRPEMLVNVELPVRLPPVVTVPADAVIDSGSHSRVYVARAADVFEPREVETGWRAGDLVEIRQGVRPGEQVVVAATFLVDSESRLQTGAGLSSSIVAENRRAGGR